MTRTPFVHIFLLTAFLVNTLGPLPTVRAQEIVLPSPGAMVSLSPEFNPPVLKGLKIDPDNPFRFEFVLDKGDGIGRTQGLSLQQEATRLIKYFLASLTIPENDLWVNLSPYEKDRIIPQSFGLTEMGRDLLAEDYMLKQIAASLIYPEGQTGKKFWKRIYEEAVKRFGTTNIPVNTFNKVWIVPEKAVVYENAQAKTAYVVESRLKVMLEEDYLSMLKHQTTNANALGSGIVREIVLPELSKEINQNKNFAQLRQVYNSLILATWYKKKIKESILNQVYADKKKVAGIEPSVSLRGTEGDAVISKRTSSDVELIYNRYLKAFKKGAYNYIKEERDPITQAPTHRKYFSGGLQMKVTLDYAQASAVPFSLSNAVKVRVDLAIYNPGVDGVKAGGRAQPADQAMNAKLNALTDLFVKGSTDLNVGAWESLLTELFERLKKDPDLNMKDVDMFIAGGLRYLGKGNRKDVDIVLQPQAAGTMNFELRIIKQHLSRLLDSLESPPDYTISVATSGSLELVLNFNFLNGEKEVDLEFFKTPYDFDQESWAKNIYKYLRYTIEEITKTGYARLFQQDQGEYAKDFVQMLYLLGPYQDWLIARQQFLSWENDPEALGNMMRSWKRDRPEILEYLKKKLSDQKQELQVLALIEQRFHQPIEPVRVVPEEAQKEELGTTLLLDRAMKAGQSGFEKVFDKNKLRPEDRMEWEQQKRQWEAWTKRPIDHPRYPTWSSREKKLIPAVLWNLHKKGVYLRGGVIQNDNSLEGAAVVESILGLPRTPSSVWNEALHYPGGYPGALKAAGLDIKAIQREPGAAELRRGKQALVSPATVSKNGGIDLTAANMNLQTQNAGARIKYHPDPAMLQQLQNASGFVPVIIDIQPMTDLHEFLGLKKQKIRISEA